MFTTLYKSIVRPPLEYGSNIWSVMSRTYILYTSLAMYKKEAIEIENVQKRATKPVKNIQHLSYTPYNRLSGQQMLSGTQIISTSHGMTGRNFFDVFLPFYLFLEF